MENNNHSAKFLRQRKMAMALPVIVLPFLSLFAWGMGMGSAPLTAKTDSLTTPGLNISLPEANGNTKSGEENKMAFYDKAIADSAAIKERMLRDPYANHPGTSSRPTSTISLERSPNQNVDRVYQKLDAINSTLNSEQPTPAPRQYSAASNPVKNADAETAKLENMMSALRSQQAAGEQNDPEMTQLNGMLEKILDIQHPQRMQDKLRQSSEANRGKAYVVTTKRPKNMVSLLGSKANMPQKDTSNGVSNAFFGQNNRKLDDIVQNTVGAVVHQDQTITSGSTIKLRLINDVYINGSLIPKNTLVSGIALLNGERLSVEITAIRSQSSIFPVSLSIYDQDGLPGIHIEGALGTEALKESAQQTVSQLNLGTMDQGLGAQAASAGIELSKNLFGKKIKQVRVNLPAGYVLLLFDNKQNNQ